MREDDFDPDRFRIDHTDPRYTQKADRVPRRIQKRREQFVMLPWWWAERLKGTSDKAWYVAAFLLHEAWKANSNTVKVPNGMLKTDGVSRQSKWRILRGLERRGLISVKSRPNRSPLVELNLPHP